MPLGASPLIAKKPVVSEIVRVIAVRLFAILRQCLNFRPELTDILTFSKIGPKPDTFYGGGDGPGSSIKFASELAKPFPQHGSGAS